MRNRTIRSEVQRSGFEGQGNVRVRELRESVSTCSGLLFPLAVWLVASILITVLLSVGCPKPHKSHAGIRVVSLVPSVTEIIFRVGASSALVGNTTFCNYPESARYVYKVGDFLNPDIERIAQLKPDIVFLTMPTHRLIAEKLSEMGIRYYTSQPATVEDVFREIDSVGQLLAAGTRAKSLVDSLRVRLDSLPVFPDTPTVYVEISDSPLMAAGPLSFVSSLIVEAGGRNICRGAQEYPVVDPEYVVKAGPDVILALYPGVSPAKFAERLGWDRVPAVRNNRIYTGLDLDLLSRPGPRVVEAIVTLSHLIHPELQEPPLRRPPPSGERR